MHGRTTPGQAQRTHRVTTAPPPPPQSLGLAYRLAEQWRWDWWRQLDGDPPPPCHTIDLDPGGGTWKPDKTPHKKASLRLHAGLLKSHISIPTQIRTSKMGLAAFLHRCRVPGFESPACPRGWQWETPKHVVLQGPRFSGEHQSIRRPTSTTDSQQLTSSPRAAAALAVWFPGLDILPRFSWAQDQLPPLT